MPDSPRKHFLKESVFFLKKKKIYLMISIRRSRDIAPYSLCLCVYNICVLCCAKSLSRVWLFAIPGTVAHQAPLSMSILQAILEWVAWNVFRASTDVSARCFHAQGLILIHLNMLVWTSLKRTVFTSPPNPKAHFFFLTIAKVILYFINFPYETWASEEKPTGKTDFFHSVNEVRILLSM